MSNDIVVSVVCNAYNHAPYIGACLDSLLSQRTDFGYELLVHDDASADGTADIIRAYAAKYPDRVKPIYQTENQYRQGGVLRFQFPRAKGKYIAMCEGDDYWTDPLKLQKQVDAMEAHPEADICAHAASRIDGRTGAVIGLLAPAEDDCLLPPQAVIAGGGTFVATSSLLFRASLNDELPPFRARRKSDYTLQIHGALRGGMLYLADNMSVYRFRAPGSWSAAQRDDPRKRQGFIDRVTETLRQLDADTEGRYHDAIERRITRYNGEALVKQRDFKALLRPEYAGYVAALPRFQRLGIRAAAVCPGLYGLWRRIRRRG